MLGFAYEIPEDFQTTSYSTRSYEKIRSTRPAVIKQIRTLHSINKNSKPGELILYVAINTVNNKLYVGITCRGLENRKLGHFYDAQHGSKARFHRAIRKYGEAAFEFCIYGKIRFGGYNKLLYNEKQLIAAIMPEYNSTSGGVGSIGYIYTDEARERLSHSHQAQAEKLRGIPRPKEVIKKWVTTRRANGNYVSCWKGKKRSKETCEKIRNNRPSARPVLCLTDNKSYSSIDATARAYKIDPSTLRGHLKGQKSKALKGLEFKFMINE